MLAAPIRAIDEIHEGIFGKLEKTYVIGVYKEMNFDMTEMFKRIDTVFVPTREIEKAFKWYVEILGGIPGWKSENGEYQSVQFGDTSLTLFLTDEQIYFQPRRSAFNFYVQNAEEAYNYLKITGVTVEEVKEYGAKYFAFFDLDENRSEVCEY